MWYIENCLDYSGKPEGRGIGMGVGMGVLGEGTGHHIGATILTAPSWVKEQTTSLELPFWKPLRADLCAQGND